MVGFWKNKKFSAEHRERLSESHKGQGKGVPLSKKHRRKLSEARKGIKFTEEHKKNIGKSAKGRSPWLKGRKHTLSSRKKMSESSKGQTAGMAGKKHSQATKDKISKSRTGILIGEKHFNWRGGISSGYGMSMRKWRALRKLILERDLFKCRDCKKTHHEVILDVHHIIPYRVSKSNAPENLIALCRKCHMKWDAKFRKEEAK